MVYIHSPMNTVKHCLLLFCSILLCCAAIAQEADGGETLLYSSREEIPMQEPDALFRVKEIRIEGNKHTRNSAVYRELSFTAGQEMALNKLADELAESRKRLMNTGMFLDVTVTLSSLRGYEAYVKIDLRERWYIYPLPFVKMIDRNVGQWMREKGMDFNRVNYGIKFTHKNFSGLNDKATLNVTNGYTRALGFSYQGLFLDKKMKWSASLGASMGQNKEINYKTQGNKQLAFKDENFVYSYFNAFTEVRYRPAIFTTHRFGFRYASQMVDDTIMTINPSYTFNHQRVRQPELYYNVDYFNVDFIPYPTKGLIVSASVSKKGFKRPLNVWQMNLKTSASWPITPKSFFNLRTAGMLKLPFKQPDLNKSLIGFNDMYMQGYEYFVIDGVMGGYSKATMARQLFSTNIGIPSERFRRLNHIPLKVYAKVYGNMGYVYNPRPGDNPLANRVLVSGGVGLDIITFYDFIIKLEWSFNQIGQNGLNLHRKDYF
ncbi:Surface antigen variable number repeat-containing protein [Cnuella takakiae]|uniref:Surface antigen variable number repeat-containing protein n=2 Tax=Cnuella takakiae TaxID=1302690 RepID=A0A1M5D7B4_9BACT|nr:Surface antigen variable number repeat-containing protein [Cnuella takakiae]